MKNLDASSSWWGNFELENGACQQWNIGPLDLLICRLDKEWQLAYRRRDETDFEDKGWHSQSVAAIDPQYGKIHRFIFKEATGSLSISPMLADRPVISRPLSPFNLVAGEEVTLYVSSPVWIALAAGDAQKTLEEIGIQRPSDTWFGPSTLQGELCYASTTHCRLTLEELPPRSYRAVTPLQIRNYAESTLAIERLMVPATLLSLYASSTGQLWTPKITLTREEDGEMAALKIEQGVPQQAGELVQLCQPRKSGDEGVLVRAFNAVFN